jgi:hypothetical protein
MVVGPAGNRRFWGATGAAQTPKIDDIWPAQKPCIKNQRLFRLMHGFWGSGWPRRPPEIVDFGGLGGPGGPQKSSNFGGLGGPGWPALDLVWTALRAAKLKEKLSRANQRCGGSCPKKVNPLKEV